MSSKLGLDSFAQLFGVSQLGPAARQLLPQFEFEYRKLSEAERDGALYDILKRIHNDELRPSGESRQGDWDRGWGENLKEYVESNHSLEKLVPKYFKLDPTLRLNNQLVKAISPHFELNFIKIARSIVAEEYFSGLSQLFEFGCGTGYHLVGLAQQLPHLNICGMDWARPTVEIIGLLAKQYSLKLTGRHFDYFNPDISLDVPSDSGFFTFASLEQVGTRHDSFIDFILLKKPAICVHVECINELYEEDNFLDYLAILYHKKRNYLSGFLSRLLQLQELGRASVVRAHRVNFGSAYHDAYSVVVWKPL